MSGRDAMVKAQELLHKTLPRNPPEDYVCSLLHDCACLLHAAGTAQLKIREEASCETSVPEYLTVLVKAANMVSTKILKWLRIYTFADNLACVKDRMELIYAGGIKEGDAELWMACLKGPSKAGARSVAGSEDSSLLSLFTKATGSGHLPIGERNIPVKAHPSFKPEDSRSVNKALELIAGLLSERRSEDPTLNPLSTAGTSAPSKNAPTG